MSTGDRATDWTTDVDPRLTVCGQLHPEFGVPCDLDLGHSTLGATGHERAHHGVLCFPDDHSAWPVTWTMLADHRWRIDQRRRGRHPASGTRPFRRERTDDRD